MPANRALPTRVQRHFSPLAVSTIFKNERFLSPSPLSYHATYSPGKHLPSGCPADPAVADNLVNSKNPKNSKQALIPKPPREVTRLKRGGYNLKDALGWSDEQYSGLQGQLQQVAEKDLELNKTWHEQTAVKKREFLKKAKQDFPIFCNYQRAWPASDFMIIYLKNTKARITGKKAEESDLDPE